MQLRSYMIGLPAFFIISAFVPRADATAFMVLDLGLLATLFARFERKVDGPLLALGLPVVAMLGLRAFTGSYFVTPFDVGRVLAHVLKST